MIEFKTETEKFLYEERKLMREERDQAIEELEALKQKSRDTFYVHMYNMIPEDAGLVKHPTDYGTMIIKKDGGIITLEPNEIKEVVKAAGGNFKR